MQHELYLKFGCVVLMICGAELYSFPQGINFTKRKRETFLFSTNTLYSKHFKLTALTIYFYSFIQKYNYAAETVEYRVDSILKTNSTD